MKIIDSTTKETVAIIEIVENRLVHTEIENEEVDRLLSVSLPYFYGHKNGNLYVTAFDMCRNGDNPFIFEFKRELGDRGLVLAE